MQILGIVSLNTCLVALISLSQRDNAGYRQCNKLRHLLPTGGAAPPSAPTDEDLCPRGLENQGRGCGHPRSQ